MRCIGIAGGISLHAQDDSYISYFNSPFIGHRRSSSIDVYPSDGTWGSHAFSPTDGKITEIRTISMGKKKVFPSSQYDYAIGIVPEGVEDAIVRILHCKPGISVGDSISRGDFIGSLVRSRYFCFWTGPHYHIEAMNPKHFARPSQSFPIISNVGGIQVHKGTSSSKFECEVVRSTKDIVVCASREYSYAKSGPFLGHFALAGKMPGILDAGVPHYKHGGVLMETPADAGSQVHAWNAEIGCVSSSANSLSHFQITKPLRITLNEVNLGGLSTHLYSKKQLIKGSPPLYLIPERYGQFERSLTVGERVILIIE